MQSQNTDCVSIAARAEQSPSWGLWVVGSLVALLIAAGLGWFAIGTDPTRVARNAVMDSVRSQLKDPSSAKFAAVYLTKSRDMGCGHVNAKNAFGGYVGDTMFVSTKGAAGDWETTLDPNLDRLEAMVQVAAQTTGKATAEMVAEYHQIEQFHVRVRQCIDRVKSGSN